MNNSDGLNGQWVGTYSSSTTTGTIVVNIDEQELNYVGEAYLIDDNRAAPALVAFFTTPNKESKFQFRADLISWFDGSAAGGFGGFVGQDAIAPKYPQGTAFSKYADVEGTHSNDTLTLSESTDLGTTGNCWRPRPEPTSPSHLRPRA